MKRLFVFVPAILLALFLFNSFVLKKDVAKLTKNKPGLFNTVYKSSDGGKTWQDISEGLPEDLREDGIRGDSLFANDKGLFVRDGKGVYHSTPHATAPFWSKEMLPDEKSGNAPGRSGIFYWGVNLKKTNGTSVWSPIFENYERPGIRSVFETAGGTVFIGTEKGIFKTDNNGKNWKHVYAGGWAGHLAESDGVLVSTSKRSIIRSTDNGENWALAISEDSVVFDVKQIKGGFAAITSKSEPNSPKTSRLSTSYDGGKTWQPSDGLRDKDLIDLMWQTWNDRPSDRLRMQAVMTYITQVGENFFCTHRDGIFRSSDKGKTWTLILPAAKDKIITLLISGNVIYAIYAIPGKGGC